MKVNFHGQSLERRRVKYLEKGRERLVLRGESCLFCCVLLWFSGQLGRISLNSEHILGQLHIQELPL